MSFCLPGNFSGAKIVLFESKREVLLFDLPCLQLNMNYKMKTPCKMYLELITFFPPTYTFIPSKVYMAYIKVKRFVIKMLKLDRLHQNYSNSLGLRVWT